MGTDFSALIWIGIKQKFIILLLLLLAKLFNFKWNVNTEVSQIILFHFYQQIINNKKKTREMLMMNEEEDEENLVLCSFCTDIKLTFSIIRFWYDSMKKRWAAKWIKWNDNEIGVTRKRFLENEICNFCSIKNYIEYEFKFRKLNLLN